MSEEVYGDELTVTKEDEEVVINLNGHPTVHMNRETASKVAIHVLRAANELYFEREQ